MPSTARRPAWLDGWPASGGGGEGGEGGTGGGGETPGQGSPGLGDTTNSNNGGHDGTTSALQVFGRVGPRIESGGLTIALYDEAGRTTDLMKRAGLGYRKLSGGADLTGGNVMYLSDTEAGIDSELFGAAVTATEVANVVYQLPARPDVLLRGVSQSELHFKGSPAALSLDGSDPLVEGGVIAKARHGEGFFLIVPWLDPAAATGPNMLRAPKIERLYSTLLTNLGVRQGGISLFDGPGLAGAEVRQVEFYAGDPGPKGLEFYVDEVTFSTGPLGDFDGRAYVPLFERSPYHHKYDADSYYRW